MKLATYEYAGKTCVGAVDTDSGFVVDLAAASGGQAFFDSMLTLIRAGEEGMQATRAVTASAGSQHRRRLANIRLMAPLPLPEQIRDFLVFPDHITQSAIGQKRLAAQMEGLPPPADLTRGPVPAPARERPVSYISNRFNVSGPDDEVVWPRYSKVIDFELELAAVIGMGGRDIARENARSHIFGYTLFNDLSARDRQYLDMQGGLGPGKGKSFDGGNAFGPWIVTADEIPDPYSVPMEARINGELVSKSSTTGMLHSFEDMIAYVSECETIMPGEIFGSGTVNSGCGLELDRYMADGDVIELSSPAIGKLRSRIRVA